MKNEEYTVLLNITVNVTEGILIKFKSKLNEFLKQPDENLRMRFKRGNLCLGYNAVSNI